MAKKSYDALFKLLLIGDSSVGKTCLIVKYVDGDFSNTFISTIGIDFKIKTITIDKKTIKLQIWDTAGQERFRTITASYYRGAMGILLVYSITHRGSFENVSKWMEAIKDHASDTVCKILVGNKSDMEGRQVSKEEGERIAKQHNSLFIETSAKTGENVNEAFEKLSEKILSTQPNLLNTEPSSAPKLNLNHERSNQSGGGSGYCC